MIAFALPGLWGFSVGCLIVTVVGCFFSGFFFCGFFFLVGGDGWVVRDCLFGFFLFFFQLLNCLNLNSQAFPAFALLIFPPILLGVSE